MAGKGSVESLANRTAHALADLSLRASPGEYLGAEDDLLTLFGVSRPTLRQAAKMVERDGLISIRRGVRGGIFAERPDAQDAIRSLARFLRIKGASLQHIMQAVRPVSEEAVVSAARRRNEQDVEHLQSFIARLERMDLPREMLAAELELTRMIAGISGNPMFELMLEIGFSFGSQEEGNFYADAGRRATIREMQRRICVAIIDGDPDIALILHRRRTEQIQAWLGGKAGSEGLAA